MTRTLLFASGLAVLAGLWGSPLPAVAETRFSAHMLLHMGLVSVAAPLLAVGVAGGRFDPTGRWPVLWNAVVASAAELAVVWGWHAPAFHHAARHDTATFVAEQASFLLAGVWLWLAAVGGHPDREPHRTWSGVAALLFTSMHMTLLGALFAMASRPMYASSGTDALSDLHLGGGIMLILGGVSYLAGGLWLSLRGLRAQGAFRRGTA